jgi:hypothetical protein
MVGDKSARLNYDGYKKYATIGNYKKKRTKESSYCGLVW